MEIKKNFYLLVFLTLILLNGCSDKKNIMVFKSTQYVEYSIIDSTIFIGVPIDLKFYNDKLYISDFYGDSLIISYSLNDRTSERFGRKGEGPKDISSPSIVFLYDEKLYIYSKNIFKLGFFDLLDSTSAYKEYNYLRHMSSLVSEIVLLKNNKFLTSGYFDDGRYTIYNGEGNVYQTFGEYPDFFTEEIRFPFDAKAMFHQLIFDTNFNTEKAVGLSPYVMDIIDIGEKNQIKRVLLSNYKYHFNEGDFIKTEESENTPTGAISLSTTNQHIYVLFNTNTPADSKISNNEIWVFDWEGNPIKKIIPDINIILIAAESDSTIYAISQEINDKTNIIKLNL